MTNLRVAIPGLLLQLACACRAPVAVQSGWAEQLDRDVWRGDDPAAFHPLDPDAVWSDGDRVRYAIESDAAGHVRRWVLELSLPDAPDHHGYHTVVRADPQSGFRRVDALSNGWRDDRTGTDLMRYSGNAPLRVRLRRLDREGEFDTTVTTQVQAHVWQEQVTTEADFGLQFLFDVLLKIDRLLEELLDVIRAPSVMSVLSRGMRVEVRLEADAEEVPRAIEVDTPFGRVPAFWRSYRLWANDQVALELRFLITWRRSPLNLSFGVLRIEGRHPDDPARRLSVRVTGATRGTRDQRIERGDLGPPGLRAGMTEAEFLGALGASAERRYRLTVAGEVHELLSVSAPAPHTGLVGVFVAGRLRFVNTGGQVSRYLEGRGGPAGPFARETLVWSRRR